MEKQISRIKFNQPVGDVFANKSILQNGLEWWPGLFEIKSITGVILGIASQFASFNMFLNGKSKNLDDFVRYKPSKLVFKAEKLSCEEPDIIETVSVDDRLSLTLLLQTSGLVNQEEPMVMGKIRSEAGADFGNLEDFLETYLPLTKS